MELDVGLVVIEEVVDEEMAGHRSTSASRTTEVPADVPLLLSWTL